MTGERTTDVYTTIAPAPGSPPSVFIRIGEVVRGPYVGGELASTAGPAPRNLVIGTIVGFRPRDGEPGNPTSESSAVPKHRSSRSQTNSTLADDRQPNFRVSTAFTSMHSCSSVASSPSLRAIHSPQPAREITEFEKSPVLTRDFAWQMAPDAGLQQDAFSMQSSERRKIPRLPVSSHRASASWSDRRGEGRDRMRGIECIVSMNIGRG